ncbi:hypothetical protein ACJEM5_23635 [Escherichia coli]|uniref:hypothetical protein n=1 Tax=Escherichia coli TaxID=562 RepID=UPI00226F3469|nr:hypothetical protein [Escherichia coli]MCY0205686.1 hypothetical protein [Escherichia coli]
MGSCAAPSAKGDDKFITTDYLQQCPAMNVRIASRTHISIQNWSPSGEGTEDCCFIALGY